MALESCRQVETRRATTARNRSAGPGAKSLNQLDHDAAQADIESKMSTVCPHVTPHSQFSDSFLPDCFDSHIDLECLRSPLPDVAPHAGCLSLSSFSTAIGERSFGKQSCEPEFARLLQLPGNALMKANICKTCCGFLGSRLTFVSSFGGVAQLARAADL